MPAWSQRRHDETISLYYLRARYMDPSTGTFLSMDRYEGSIYDPDGLNKYLYANANPVKYADPSGNMFTVAEAAGTSLCRIYTCLENVHLFGMFAGLGNMAVNSLLGEQGMDVVKTFFEGYKTGLYVSGILYFVAAVSVQAFAVIYFVMSIADLSMSLVLLVASVREHNTKGILVYSVLTIMSVLSLADACGKTCEVYVIGDKGTANLKYEGGSETKDIYRAVGVDEYYDIMQTGKFRGVQGSFAAKEFGNDFSETLDFANKSINKDKVAIIKVTIPESVYNQLHHMNLDAPIFKSGTPVVEPEMLDFFNNSILNIEHVY